MGQFIYSSSVYVFLVLAGFLGFTSDVRAEVPDLCICQTGTEPTYQVPAFKLGCKSWSNDQTCSEKLIVSASESLEEIMFRYPDVRNLKIGYVGHWSSSRETVNYLNENIVPLVQKNRLTVSIDNTACYGTINPYYITGYLKSRDIPKGSISFKGNQTVSTGLWEKGLPGKHNFWANINSRLEVEYPKCKEFEGKTCLGIVQNKKYGICYDDAQDMHVILDCIYEQDYLFPGHGETSESTVREARYRWKRDTEHPGLGLIWDQKFMAQRFMEEMSRY